ncbi:hypothetical protein BC937DRAFT_93221, partial [Endogone sp. FLAS-F59071]
NNQPRRPCPCLPSRSSPPLLHNLFPIHPPHSIHTCIRSIHADLHKAAPLVLHDISRPDRHARNLVVRRGRPAREPRQPGHCVVDQCRHEGREPEAVLYITEAVSAGRVGQEVMKHCASVPTRNRARLSRAIRYMHRNHWCLFKADGVI